MQQQQQSWRTYFAGGSINIPASQRDNCIFFNTPQTSVGSFHVYWTASQSILLQTSPPNSLPNTCGTLFVLVHGAGQSALHYALMASYLANNSDCVVIAPDLRKHGLTSVDESSPDLCLLSRHQYACDLGFILNHLFPGLLQLKTVPPCKASSINNLPNNVVLVGHSLGGAIVTHLATLSQFRLSHLLGVVVLDVVEGTAIYGLDETTLIITRRPNKFSNMESAIRWTLDSGTIRNEQSAQVSVPAQLVPIEDGPAVCWRTDLLETRSVWKEWFTGLSSLFLKCPAAKLLILAGTDRLDKELTIGHMQGKFQMEVVPKNVGHNLHADAPLEVAQIIHQFAERNACPIIPLRPNSLLSPQSSKNPGLPEYSVSHGS